MAKMTININDFEVQIGETVLQALHKNGAYIDAPCGGRGTCGKCKAKIVGALSGITEEEKEILTDEEIAENIRLTCQAKINGDIVVFLENTNFEVEVKTNELHIDITPSVDVQKYKNELGKAIGLAVDIGTTTVAAFFYDLVSGERIYVASGVNKQKAYGADVMSRIGYCTNNPNGNVVLKDAIIGQINELIEEFCSKTKNKADYIVDTVITGNTTMLLLAAGFNIISLGYLPFEPESLLGEYISSERVGLKVHKSSGVYFMPAISGFLGGDAVAVMLSCDFDLTEKTSYMVDIGTNGEMALKHNGEIYGCSTAAGPAFEGAQIRFGSGSVNGAIRKVEEINNSILLEVIGDYKPMSICGSGILDAIALMFKSGAIDETGRIDEDEAVRFKENIFECDDEPCFSLVDDKSIYITQKDVREVQLAKAAIAAGTYMLNHTAKIDDKDVDRIFVAGGFGSAINLKSASEILMLPKYFCDNADVIGNAAGTGAILALLSKEHRARAEKIARQVKVVELSGDPVFENEFVEKIMF